MVFGWRVGSNPVFCLVRGICRDGMDVHLTPLATVKYGPHVSSSIVFFFFFLCTLSSSSSSPTSAPRARLRPAPPRTRRRCSAGHAPALRPARAGTPAAPARRSDRRAPVLRPPPRAAPTAARRCSVRPRAPLHPSRAGTPPAPARRSALPCAPLRPELDELGRRRSSLLRAELRRRCSSLLRWELDELGRRRPSFLDAEPVVAPPSPSRSRRRTTPSKWVGVVRSIWADHSDPDLRGIFPLGDEPNPPRLQTKQL